MAETAEKRKLVRRSAEERAAQQKNVLPRLTKRLLDIRMLFKN